jgi:hypothetical protein
VGPRSNQCDYARRSPNEQPIAAVSTRGVSCAGRQTGHCIKRKNYGALLNGQRFDKSLGVLVQNKLHQKASF